MQTDEERQRIGVGEVCPMGELPIGSTASITEVRGEGRLRRRIFDMGLTPGTEVYIRKRAPLGDPLEITVRGYELTLRKSEAMNVMVKATALPDKGK
jgi:Fe2+ transport system protein FeoA